MSFEPITRWVLRCDGPQTHRQPCRTLLVYRYDANSREPSHSGHDNRAPSGHTDNDGSAARDTTDADRGSPPRELAAHTQADDSPVPEADSAASLTAACAAVWVTAVFDRPMLSRHDDGPLRAAGWLRLRDGRVLCPHHVAALEYLAHAELDGLPFEHGETA